MMTFERISDAWYRRKASAVGVPDMLIEDAVQEMKLAVWQGRNAHYACIDFARRMIYDMRYGVMPSVTSLDAVPEPVIERTYAEAWLDVQAMFRRLPERLRLILAAHVDGYRDIEIARHLQLSQRRVGQLRANAMRALQ